MSYIYVFTICFKLLIFMHVYILKFCDEFCLNHFQMMISRTRSDIDINLPALIKLDALLIVRPCFYPLYNDHFSIFYMFLTKFSVSIIGNIGEFSRNRVLVRRTRKHVDKLKNWFISESSSASEEWREMVAARALCFLWRSLRDGQETFETKTWCSKSNTQSSNGYQQ